MPVDVVHIGGVYRNIQPFLHPGRWNRKYSLLILLVLILFLITGSGCTGNFLSSPRQVIEIDKEEELIKPGILITDNSIYQNNRSGVRVRGDTPVEINNSDIYQNGRAGINLERSAKVLINDCEIFQNKTSGIGANNANQILLRNNNIHQNQQGGVRVRQDEASVAESAYVSLMHNKIFLNQQGGINAIADSLAPLQLVVSENTLYHNYRSGIRIEDNVHMSAMKNEIYQNLTAGISSFTTTNLSPLLDVYQNKIYFNHGSGIFVLGGISGSIGITDNFIYNNLRGGIACGLWDAPGDEQVDLEIYHNTIVGNGSDQQGAGIRNDSRGDVIIKNNIIAYNLTTGIMTRNCKDTSYNLLFANGETSTTSSAVSDRLSFLIDKVQYAGCSGRQWGDILAPPLFVNPDAYNFSLQENSPARNGADPIASPYFLEFPNANLGAASLNFPDTQVPR